VLFAVRLRGRFRRPKARKSPDSFGELTKTKAPAE
jgi:hypothetical protein